VPPRSSGCSRAGGSRQSSRNAEESRRSSTRSRADGRCCGRSSPWKARGSDGKLLPYLRLALFCIALFGVSGAVVLLKQGRLMAQKHREDDPKSAASGERDAGGANGAREVQAGLGGLDAIGPSGASGSGVRDEPSGPEEARRQQAVTTGRALFDLPEPISIAEATELMNDLKRQKEENARRKAALDQHERELEIMESELESRRIELIALAEKIDATLPDAAGARDAAAQVDPVITAKVAKALEAMIPTDAAKVLDTYPPERAADILLKMSEKKMALVLAQVKEDRLAKVTDALLKIKSESTE
jgi:flagellar motility protein MotE (MotC chaperone)